MDRVLIIMNPNAGIKRAKPFLTDIINQFCKNSDAVTVMLTQKRGDGTAFAEKYAAEYDKIVAIGGDGTLSEVVNGLMNGFHNVPVAYIPAGSTNDFALSMNIPKNIITAANIAANGTPRLLDVGVFNERYFSYVASFGAFTRASYATPQDLKNFLGRLAYFLEGIKDLSSIKPIHMRLETDKAVYDDNYIFGAFSNTTSVAGILSYDPACISLNDNKFEILLIKFPTTLIELNEIIVSLLSSKYNHPSITFASASSAVCTSDDNIIWNLDGEQAENRSVNRISIAHNALSLIL